MDARLSRVIWHHLEAINAVTYFSPECREAPALLGLRGFWMGYFACRAAPMGPVSAAVVAATFFNFHPARVRRAIPDAWSWASPGDLLEARAGAAAAALRRLLTDGRAEQLAATRSPSSTRRSATVSPRVGRCSQPTAMLPEGLIPWPLSGRQPLPSASTGVTATSPSSPARGSTGARSTSCSRRARTSPPSCSRTVADGRQRTGGRHSAVSRHETFSVRTADPPLAAACCGSGSNDARTSSPPPYTSLSATSECNG